MSDFILISLDANKNPLKESVDINGLIDKASSISDMTSVMESLDVLSENGYRVIVNTDPSPYIYGNSLNEGIKELYNKFKDRFKNKDEFEKAYEAIREKKMKEGTWHPKSPTPTNTSDNASPDISQPSTQPTQKPTDARSAIPNIVNRVGAMFKNDPDGYKMLITQLQNKLR